MEVPLFQVLHFSVGVLFVQELLTLGLPSNSPFEEEVFGSSKRLRKGGMTGPIGTPSLPVIPTEVRSFRLVFGVQSYLLMWLWCLEV